MDTEQLKRLRQRLASAPDQVSDLERAVLAYARWHGPDETELQRSVARKELDVLILRMEPEEWQGLRDHVEILGEVDTRKLMSYSLGLAKADIERLRSEVEQLPERRLNHQDDDDEGEGIASPSRRRDRDRC